ncbi:uncharacterized protein LOC125678275 isoform X1 [Ostrea edulis]|uniref:uncharacterized protein LOC125678275 isoform X1 n=1 Tax=Ostrea edulis TaxID=37623 RepID=UPI0020955EF7|nr:uncharacterized protein LOC125678275 isoform X1 [Ostrea edulis]
MRLLFLTLMIGMERTLSYHITLKNNESGRFVYPGNTGGHLYCTVCQTGNNDVDNRVHQEPTCVRQNFKVLMPNNGAYPICKEGVNGSVIPGCGPLPTSRDLSWKTDSGRPIQENSTVYEVYYPKCRLPGKLNRKLMSVRCGEDLTWDVDPSGIACRYGCGPLPNKYEWKIQNGDDAGNYSLTGKTYVPVCATGLRASGLLHCNESNKWAEPPSSVKCTPTPKQLTSGKTYVPVCATGLRASGLLHCNESNKWAEPPSSVKCTPTPKQLTREGSGCTDETCIIGICSALLFLVIVVIVLAFICFKRRKKTPVRSDSLEMRTYSDSCEVEHCETREEVSPLTSKH